MGRHKVKVIQHKWDDKWLKTAAKVMAIGGNMSQVAKAISQSYKVSITKNAVIGRIRRVKQSGNTIFDNLPPVEMINGKPITALLRFWNDGIPVNDIADHFGIHRNTVYEKAIGYGLSARDSGEALKSIHEKSKDKRLTKRDPNYVHPAFKSRDTFPNLSSVGIGIMELTRRNQCRFVIGDGPFMFCGAAIDPGSSSSYCRACHKVVYIPSRSVGGSND